MAAIEQIIQIASNERVANAAIPHDAITVQAGSGVTVAGVGNARTYTFGSPAAFNLSDVETFENATARNASTATQWHRGDIAILTSSEDITEGGGDFADTPFTYSAFVTATSFRVNGGWDNAAGTPAANLGFAVNSVIRFRNTSGDIAGSTVGGTDFTVQSITQQSAGSGNAIVTVDRSTLPAATQPTIDTGSVILAQGTPTTTTVVAGTYVFTANDQTAANPTLNEDWTLLQAPAGFAAVERNFYMYSGTTLTITGLASGSTAGDQTFTVNAGTGSWTSTYGNAGVPTIWPQASSLFGNGLKLTYGTDWTFNDDRTVITITISQAERIDLGDGNTRTLNLEMETLIQ